MALNVVCCHIPQAGTARNFDLRHGSFRGFLEHYKLDIFTVQALKLSSVVHVLLEALHDIKGLRMIWWYEAMH